MCPKVLKISAHSDRVWIISLSALCHKNSITVSQITTENLQEIPHKSIHSTWFPSCHFTRSDLKRSFPPSVFKPSLERRLKRLNSFSLGKNKYGPPMAIQVGYTPDRFSSVTVTSSKKSNLPSVILTSIKMALWLPNG